MYAAKDSGKFNNINKVTPSAYRCLFSLPKRFAFYAYPL